MSPVGYLNKCHNSFSEEKYSVKIVLLYVQLLYSHVFHILARHCNFLWSDYLVLVDIYSDICGQFDSIWDKNSFGAINPVDRDR